MPTSATSAFSATNRLDPLYEPEDAQQVVVALAPSLTFVKGQVLAQLEADAVQTVTITGTPTSGTFTLTYGAQTTAAIAYNATANAVEEALELLSTIGEANVAVTGGPGPGTAWVVEFVNQLADKVVTAITATGSFGGGSSPAIAVTNTTTGVVPGKFTKYNPDGTDGSQNPRGLLTYGCTTDASGNTTLIGEWGDTQGAVPMFYKGTFRCEDVLGLDAGALTALGGHLIYGTFAAGAFTL